MNDMFRRKAIEAKMQQMVSEPSEEIQAQLDKSTEWYGTCKRCGKQRTGTLASLKAPCGCNAEG
jgi:hypothetical protein